MFCMDVRVDLLKTDVSKLFICLKIIIGSDWTGDFVGISEHSVHV